MIEIMTLVLLFVLLIFFIDFSAEWSLFKFIKDFNEHWEVEQIFRNNIWSLSIAIIILLFWYWLYTENIINIIAPMLSVIAFWYWYDKYKRDKETDILQKNLDFKKDLLSSEISEIEKVSLIYSEFERVRDMRDKWYMSEEIFKNIKEDLSATMKYNMKIFVFKLDKNILVDLRKEKQKTDPIIIEINLILWLLFQKEDIIVMVNEGISNLLWDRYKEVFFDRNIIYNLFLMRDIDRLDYILYLYRIIIGNLKVDYKEINETIKYGEEKLKELIEEEKKLNNNNTNQ